jgi:HPt (histidine-containing phosphotransfer) domain-containing protein
MVHTLKSNAGQLNKTSLQKAAADIENSLKSEENHTTPEQMSILESELNAALMEFTPMITVQSVPADEPLSSSFDTEAARELIDKLELLFENGNPECLIYIDSLLSIPGSEEVIQHMENIDFQSAAAALTKWKERMM